MGDGDGLRIDGHRIEAEIHRGPRATVHRATQLPQGRTVALKTLTGGDALARSRFAQEAAAAAARPHPHLVPVLGSGVSGASAWMSMRYVDGPSLSDLLRAPGGLEARRAIDLLGQAGEALDHLAGAGAVHGAVRPDNVLVEPGEHALLTPFGTDAALRPGPARAAGPAADRRALAATAYEALTGAPSARGGPPASARVPALGAAVDAALAATPDTASAFVAGLAAAASATPGAGSSRAAARPVPAPPPAARTGPPPPPVTVTAPLPVAPPPPAGPSRSETAYGPRWRVPAIVAGVLVVLVAVIAAIGALAGGGGGHRTVTRYVEAPAPPVATTAPGLSAAYPLGDVLPAAVDGWALTPTDPAVVNLDLAGLGRVETAEAVGPAGVALLAGVRPFSDDGRVLVERLRRDLGGTGVAAVALGGAAGTGQAQERGGVWAVSFGTADRAVVALAGDRDAAVSLATAASAALHP